MDIIGQRLILYKKVVYYYVYDMFLKSNAYLDRDIFTFFYNGNNGKCSSLIQCHV